MVIQLVNTVSGDFDRAQLLNSHFASVYSR